MIKKVLAAGKQVVCEKPVTMTEGEFDELLSLDAERKVCVIFQNRLNPSIEAFKEIVDSGRMGKIKTAKAISKARTEMVRIIAAALTKTGNVQTAKAATIETAAVIIAITAAVIVAAICSAKTISSRIPYPTAELV
jgi:hypothetical protein